MTRDNCKEGEYSTMDKGNCRPIMGRHGKRVCSMLIKCPPCYAERVIYPYINCFTNRLNSFDILHPDAFWNQVYYNNCNSSKNNQSSHSNLRGHSQMEQTLL